MGHIFRRQGVYGAPDMGQNAPFACGFECAKTFVILFSISTTALIIVTTIFCLYRRKQNQQKRRAIERRLDLERAEKARAKGSETSSFDHNFSASPAMPGTMPSAGNINLPAIQSDCPAISASDRMRKMLGKEPKCKCRTCKDNPRVNPGQAYNAPYATSRGVTAHLPSPQQPSGTPATRNISNEVLPVYIRDDTQGQFNLPDYPQRSKSSGSQSDYSQTKIEHPAESEAPHFHSDVPHSRTPVPTHSKNFSQSSARSNSSLRSAGLPQNPRPGHRRDLINVGISLDDVVGGAVNPVGAEAWREDGDR